MPFHIALNDTIMVFTFALVAGLPLGISSISVPWATLFTSVVLYIVIPVAIAQAMRLCTVPSALWMKVMASRSSQVDSSMCVLICVNR